MTDYPGRDCPDIAHELDDLRKEIDRQRAVIAQCANAMKLAYSLIRDQFSSVEWEARHGEVVAPEARPAWNAICDALLAATAGDGGDDDTT